eukprot:6342192-Prymnesium_polylepis.1
MAHRATVAGRGLPLCMLPTGWHLLCDVWGSGLGLKRGRARTMLRRSRNVERYANNLDCCTSTRPPSASASQRSISELCTVISLPLET